MNRFSKFKVLPDLKNALLLIAMVFEALSAILTAVRRENDRAASEFHHSGGGSWPAMQPK